MSQVPFLPYAQVAEIGSLPLLDWLVATVGCGLVDALRRPRWRAPALAATLAFVVPTLYGALRLPMVENEREAAPSLRVGVVQPNIGIWEKWNPALFVPHLRALQEATRELEARGAELVVWPETSYPFPIHRSARQDRVGALAIAGNGVRGPILTGVISTDGPIVTAAVRDEHGFFVDTIEMGTGHRFNSAVGIERGGGIAAIADKVRLLAFGEYVPFWDWLPPLQGLFARGLSPGQGSQVIEVAGTRVGVLNCYEDLLADHVRWQASYEPSFWANLTNNAWFGNTSAPHLHHMNARLRAIETRRDLIRAVNTGVSGHTRATGEDTVRTGTFERASFVADVRLLRGTTPWVRFGDFVTPLLIALLGSILITGRARRATLRAETA